MLNDDVTVNYDPATFEDVAAGQNKIVYFEGLSLSGADAGNYSLAESYGVAYADIFQIEVTATLGSVDNKQYDGNVSATANATLSGVLENDMVELVTVAVFEDRNAGEDKEVYASFSLGGLMAENYRLGNLLATGSASISKLALTATATAGQSKVYGDDDPELTYMLSPATLGEGDSLTGALTRTAGETAGMYAITAGDLAVSDGNNGDNYDFTVMGGDFDILKAPLTVAANDQGKTKGEADPALTYATSGLKLSDELSAVVSGALERAPGEDAGEYAISQGSLMLTNPNYELTFTPGALTITPPAMKVASNTRKQADPGRAIESGFMGYRISQNNLDLSSLYQDPLPPPWPHFRTVGSLIATDCPLARCQNAVHPDNQNPALNIATKQP